MKIAFLTARDPRDRRSWSGTVYCMAQALQKHCGDVSYIGPIDAEKEKLVGKVIHRSSQLLLKRFYYYDHSFLVSKKYARVAAQKLTEQPFDVIVAPSGETEIAFLETDIPIMVVGDATYTLLHDYYPQYSSLLKRSYYEMNVIADLAIKKARLLLFTSTWAARSAIEDYSADPGKVFVAPFGANLENPPPREKALTRKKSDRCRLLFLGVNWERKGGDIAFETLMELEELGIHAELVVCGCTPPATFSHPAMTVIPFLDKNNVLQRRELNKLLETSDFLLLPTRSDCFGIVFCEANAFGLPVITTYTGGVPDVVRDGENGFTLPYDARGDEYARVIASVYCDEQRYMKLVRSSRAAFDDRLNWDAWGLAAKNVLANLHGVKTSRENPYNFCAF